MLHDIITYISSLDPALVLFALFFFAFIENIFPPSPSDVVIVIGSTLVTQSTFQFLPLLAVTSIGGSAGFIFMYFIGNYSGDKLIRSGKLRFIKKEYLDKTDRWFGKYGYNLILINRFLPGTRAVISFFTGVHKLKPAKTFFYAVISSVFWNSFLIFIGTFLGRNLDKIDRFLSAYSYIALSVAALVAGVIFILRRKKRGAAK